ncbi:HAD family hydrolase [Paenibacillus amylolyticus]|uniref:HAD family hydrolase n=1 Tax=Paenibacillus amylolyticus TaxID=1451 RepID=UPI003242AD39
MIYASDLDQTLVYSRRALRIPEGTPGLVPAEWINGKLSAFMSAYALERLQSLPQDIVFMPVTTRTVEQYRRIHIFQNECIPKYAVTSNGGNIIVDSQVDDEWNLHIRSLLRQQAAAPEEILDLFDDVLSPEWVINQRLCDELFFALLIERDKLPMERIADKIRVLETLGWESSIQGRKLYLVPSAVNKRAAVEHIRQRIGDVPVIASGDSLLDRCLLDFAHHAIAPSHGELHVERQRVPEQVPYQFTKQFGAFAADEILDYVHRIHKDQQTHAEIRETV